MCPSDLQTYAADAKVSWEIGKLEEEGIWLVLGWLVQKPPIENWRNLARRCIYDREI